jgi:hypothetical protein
MIVKKMLNDTGGSIIISIILGLGLAAMFRRACRGDNCMIIKAPSSKEVSKYVYRLDDACYKYTPEVVDCPWPKTSIVPDA